MVMLKAAVVQAASVGGDTAATVAKACDLIAECGRKGAGLAVFPEAFVGGYPKGASFDIFIGGRTPEGRAEFEAYWAQAIDVPGAETAALGKAVKAAGIYLTIGVIERERVITTVPKAKAVKPLVENMITLAKEDTLHSRRQAAAFLNTPASVKKLFDTLGTRFGQRNGGYTRIVRLAPRKGDGAELAMLELVGSELVKRAAERAKRREERQRAQREGREPEEEK